MFYVGYGMMCDISVSGDLNWVLDGATDAMSYFVVA